MANPRHEAADGENLPLLAKSKDSSRSSRFKRHFNAQIDTRRADVILIICFFISGLTDAGAYNAWNVFLSMQVSYAVFLPSVGMGFMAILQRGGCLRENGMIHGFSSRTWLRSGTLENLPSRSLETTRPAFQSCFVPKKNAMPSIQDRHG